jgi:arylsulfatase A-like enzyme
MIDFISRSSKSSRPFAAFLSYGTPHDPWVESNVPEEYAAMFRDMNFPNPPNYKADNDKYADNWGRLSDEQRTQLFEWRRNYYAMTANLDWNVRRLLDAIDKAGIEDNTIVVFSSDHGEMFGAHGRRAKNIFYEEAARIPFLIRYPGQIEAGSVSDACLSTVDVMPTILSLMDLDIPEAAEGMDLSHCARGEEGTEPEFAFMQNTGACAAWEDGYEWRAIRDKQYTYAIYRVDRSELLFDSANDPYQMKNLADSPEHRGTMKRFRRMLAEKMESLNDNFETCTWYRDHWIEDRTILRGAKG